MFLFLVSFRMEGLSKHFEKKRDRDKEFMFELSYFAELLALENPKVVLRIVVEGNCLLNNEIE